MNTLKMLDQDILLFFWSNITLSVAFRYAANAHLRVKTFTKITQSHLFGHWDFFFFHRHFKIAVSFFFLSLDFFLFWLDEFIRRMQFLLKHFY